MRYESETPLNNLFMSLLDVVGVRETSLGRRHRPAAEAWRPDLNPRADRAQIFMRLSAGCATRIALSPCAEICGGSTASNYLADEPSEFSAWPGINCHDDGSLQMIVVPGMGPEERRC